jgi:hypothetical protein
MGNYVSITDQAGAAVIPDDINGIITDIYVVAGGGAAGVALYDGQDTTGGLLFMHKVSTGASSAVTNCKIQFVAGGLYALVDANTEALILHGEWAKKIGAVNLSGN